jgi:hypothetical protein
MSQISGNAKNLSFAACEPFFTGYARLSRSEGKKNNISVSGSARPRG